MKLLKLMLLVLREMGNREALVEHVKTCHEEYRKGCEEFPCLWEVLVTFLCRDRAVNRT